MFPQGTVTHSELEESQKLRQKRKAERLQEAIHRRQTMASQLMGEMLAERPSLPSPPPPSHSDTSPTRTKKTPGLATAKGIKGKTVIRKVAAKGHPDTSIHDGTQPFDLDRMAIYPEDYMDIGNEDQGLDTRTRVLHQKSVEPLPRSAPKRRPVSEETETKSEKVVVRPYKPRPYTDLVRLQRPESTRSAKPRNRPQTYQQQLGQMQQKPATPRSTGSLRAQQRLYGKYISTIPGFGL